MPYTKRPLRLQMGTTNTTTNHNDYYKLRTYTDLSSASLKQLLSDRGYAVAKAPDKDTLRESLIRADMGLMSYAASSNDELRQLIADRGIDTSEVYVGSNRGSRGELLSLLDTADQDPRFERFLELPAEIRNRVYGMHFAEIQEPLVAPSQPPLTLTNRQIRAETLPMFYASIRLQVDLNREQNLDFTTMTIQRRGKLTIDRRTRSFFQCVGRPNLSLIRRFRFYVSTTDRPPSSSVHEFDVLTAFEIDLPEHGSGKAQLRLSQGPMRAPHVLRFARIFQGRIREAVAALNDRNGRIEVGIEELYGLRNDLDTV